MLKTKNTWQLQEAKNRLSELVRAAQDRGPQTITVRGKDAVVVLSAAEYAHEHPGRVKAKESLSEFFARWRGILGADEVDVFEIKGDYDPDTDELFG